MKSFVQVMILIKYREAIRLYEKKTTIKLLDLFDDLVTKYLSIRKVNG